MANPYRGVVNAARVKNSTYVVFGQREFARSNRFAQAARDAGFTDVRVTRFRVGSNKRRDFNYKVTIYWKANDAAPDTAAFSRIAGEA